MYYKCIEFDKVSHFYSLNTPNQVTALDKVTFHVNQGEFVAVVGISGSGKSTLARHCNGILTPDSGKVLINSKDTRNKKERAGLWRQVGLVQQHPEKQLFEATVFDDVAYGPKNLELSRQKIEQAVSDALTIVGLNPEKVNDLSPFDLSGGEKRRVAIAGILAFSPSILVLDEPLASLDPSGRKSILDSLAGLNKKQGTTILIITHNIEDIIHLVDKVIVMERGTIKLKGKLDKIFAEMGNGLKEAGLEVPFAVEVTNHLRNLGFPAGEAYTIESVAREIINASRGRGGHGV